MLRRKKRNGWIAEMEDRKDTSSCFHNTSRSAEKEQLPTKEAVR